MFTKRKQRMKRWEQQLQAAKDAANDPCVKCGGARTFEQSTLATDTLAYDVYCVVCGWPVYKGYNNDHFAAR